jgi:hypothetical protein
MKRCVSCRRSDVREIGHRAAERSVWNTLADLVADRLKGPTRPWPA